VSRGEDYTPTDGSAVQETFKMPSSTVLFKMGNNHWYLPIQNEHPGYWYVLLESWQYGCDLDLSNGDKISQEGDVWSRFPFLVSDYCEST